MNFKQKYKLQKNLVMGLVIGFLIGISFNIPAIASTITKMIEVYPNYVNLTVNGNEVETDNFLYNGVTYVPLRAVSELLSKKVDWNQETKTVMISDKSINEASLDTNNSNMNYDEIFKQYEISGKGVFKGYFHNVDYSDLNIFLQGGEQTKITADIQRITDNFNDNKDLSTVREIFQWMSQNLKGVEGEKFGRTSQDILTSKGVTGCTDYGLAFVALAREKGIPTVFIQTARIDWIKDRIESNSGRIVGHILAEVYIDSNNDGTKEWCLVDSTAGRLYLNYNKDNFSYPDGYFVFAKSLEVWDSGAENEQENWNVMMDLFKDFDLTLYKNPMYQYVDLLSGQIRNSGEFKGTSAVIGSSAQVLGEKEPVEYFASKYTSGFNSLGLTGFSNAQQQSVMSTQRVIALYTSNGTDNVPQYILELIPEINNGKVEFIMNTFRDGRRIILIKAADKNRLIEIINTLPNDFLDKDYN